jgi:hypothetical protein
MGDNNSEERHFAAKKPKGLTVLLRLTHHYKKNSTGRYAFLAVVIINPLG